jgi:inner membrane protein
MERNSSSSGSWSRLFRSPGFKFILIAVIVVLLMIPLFMVWGLVKEREGNARSVGTEVARSWGLQQNVKGPFLVIPFIQKTMVVSDGKQVEQEVERHAVFLPEALEIGGDVRSKVLTRSIYDVTVYNADLNVSGRFKTPEFAKLASDIVSIRWQDAVFALALSSVSGLEETANLTINGSQEIAFEPSLGVNGAGMSGIHARLFPADTPLNEPMPAFTFATKISFAGSQALRFAPAGRETKVGIKSDWPHPSFKGAFLPKNRTVNKDGFTADWRVPHLARSIPQSWVGSNFRVFNGFPGNAPQLYNNRSGGKFSTSISGGRSLDQFGRTMFGVEFYIPLDYYDIVIRALKYGLMFLVSGYAGVFIMELLSGRRVHGVQYIFVGIAMIFFYVLLLSFSEHIGFFKAYLLSSVATGGMLSLYVGKVLESAKRGFVMLGLFLLIYSFLYMILQLEDFALLAGAILGFIMLTATMFLTLKVDWSGATEIEEAPKG